MLKLPWKKKREPLGKLGGPADIKEAVSRLAKATEGDKGQLGTVMAMGAVRQTQAGQAVKSKGLKDLTNALNQLASRGEESASAMVDVVLYITGPEKAVALEVLALMGADALPAIRRGLEEGDEVARRHLLRLLPRIGGSDAVEAARSLAEDSNESVAEAAKAVLEGKPVPGMEELSKLAGGDMSNAEQRAEFGFRAVQWLVDERLLDLNRR